MRKVRLVMRIGLAIMLFGLMYFALGPGAWASTGQNGPTPPRLGDPVGADRSPHGAYSATTNYCLQCHAVHQYTSNVLVDGGDYALMYKNSVTETCKTCHTLFGEGPNGARTPVGTGIPGTTSARTAYDVYGTDLKSDHQLGSANPPAPDNTITLTEADWSYGWRNTPGGAGPPAVDATTPAGPGTASDTGGGLYCGSCHTPHGEFGQLVNSKKVWTSDKSHTLGSETLVNWAAGTRLWWKNPGPATLGPRPGETCGSPNPSDPDNPSYCVASGQPGFVYLDLQNGTNWVVCLNPPGQAGPCADAQVKDAEGQLVSWYGYKLLSMYPNHAYSTAKSWYTDYRGRDSAVWCGTCHPSKVDESLGGQYHNHPTACDYCHGNPATAGGRSDFPHTSENSMLLKAYPDALCTTCHTKGSLP